MTNKFAAIATAAIAAGADQTVAKTGGGGDYTPPAAGPCRLRFIAYVELGKQAGTFQGKPTIKDKVLLTFEVSGPKHPPTVSEDGTKTPIRISIEESLSLNEKANFFKLFQRMNYTGKAKHMTELLGEAYLGTIYHRTYKRADGTDGVAVELRPKGDTYSIRPPRFEDPETGELRVVEVAPPVSAMRCFVWSHPEIPLEAGTPLDQWNSLFIEGEYPERKDEKTGAVIRKAKSKNVYQNKVKLAKNFAGSPIFLLLTNNGQSLDIPDAESGTDPDAGPADDEDATLAIPSQQPAKAAPTGAAATDALNGIVA